MTAKLVLGTAQLGSNYGVMNRKGKPSRKYAYELLDTASSLGIGMLDTAEAYGDSEFLIGDYRRRHGDVFNLCTKLSGDLDEGSISHQMRARIQASCYKLFTPQIYLYYLHSFSACCNAKVLKALRNEREVGSIIHAGVSIYEPSELRYVIENASDIVDHVQIPFNVFNCASWISNGLIADAIKADVKLYARSVYLQGIALSNPDDSLVARLGLKEVRSQLQKLADEFDITCAELACTFVASTPGIDYIIIGCETSGQIRENVLLMQRASRIDSRIRMKILEMSEALDQRTLDPRYWNLG